MPATAKALAEGELSVSAVNMLMRAREAAPEPFAEAEGWLVESAREVSFDQLRRVEAYWRQAADPLAATEEEERRFEGRHLHASPTLDGMVRLDGDLDPETGQTVISALGAVMDAEARLGQTDLRTAPQRRADALGHECRAWLDRSDRPQVGGERPHVVVTVLCDRAPPSEEPRGSRGARGAPYRGAGTPGPRGAERTR